MRNTNPFIHEFYIDLKNGTTQQREKKPLAQGDAYADKIIVHIQDGGQDVPLNAIGVSAKAIRYDGRTVPLVGSVEDGAACVVLDPTCYAVPGDVKVSVALSAGEMVQTVLVLLMNVDTSETGVIVDNGVIGDLTEILSAIAEMKAATDAANNAAAEARDTVKTVTDEVDAAAESLTRRVNTAIADMSAQVNVAAPSVMVDTSAALVSVADAAARDAVSVVSGIAAAQPSTGDPSPDNVRPISGRDAVTLTRTGKNLLGFRDFTYTAGAYIDTCANGVFHREVTTTHETSFVVNANAMPYIENPHIPAGTYTFTLTHIGDVAYDNPYLEVTLSDGSVVNLANRKATTLPLDGTITGIRMASKSYAVGVVIEFTMQLEAGAGTEYEPYNGVTLTATLPETVYGGTLDWTTGLLTVTHFAQTFDGTEGWLQGTLSGAAVPVFYVDGMLGKAIVNNERMYHLCSHYKPTIYRASDVQIDKSCYTVNNNRLLFKDTTHSTVDAFKAYLAAQAAAGTPVTIVHPFKDEYRYTIQLDPKTLDMLKGCNAVRSDTGETSLVYVADTKMYIDNAIAAIAAAIINN